MRRYPPRPATVRAQLAAMDRWYRGGPNALEPERLPEGAPPRPRSDAPSRERPARRGQ